LLFVRDRCLPIKHVAPKVKGHTVKTVTFATSIDTGTRHARSLVSDCNYQQDTTYAVTKATMNNLPMAWQCETTSLNSKL